MDTLNNYLLLEKEIGSHFTFINLFENGIVTFTALYWASRKNYETLYLFKNKF